MEFKQLHYFVEVARIGSFSQASKLLFVTPQALSKSINLMEKEYGCRLFERNNNKLTLSEIGQEILNDAKNLMEQYYQIDQRIKQLSDIERGYFKVAVAQNSLNIVDIDLFESFRCLYPQLSPDYIELPDKLVDEYIESDRVEICLNINNLPDSNEYESILLYASELCAIERFHDYLIGKEHITLEELRDKKIVLKSELYKSHDILDEAAKDAGIALNYELKTSDETLMLDRISSPECIGIGVYAIGDVIEHHTELSVPFMPSLPWNIYLSYKKYKSLSKPVQLFIKYVKENYQIES
ncbi:MAG: LysR family transcriptional regulator [Eubacteriaceae bacterium]|nr:LysR family transcriptional regulator [Eubacteriaceae bacterium]